MLVQQKVKRCTTYCPQCAAYCLYWELNYMLFVTTGSMSDTFAMHDAQNTDGVLNTCRISRIFCT